MSRPKDESFDVSDSTDWKKTPLPSLAPVDSALRCQVCRDFYNTPMITSCSHTFCSLCIRHCLNNDAKCPTCRKGDQESKLRNNYALEELVEAFKIARPQVMDLAKRGGEVVSSSSPKRKRLIEAEESSSPVRKRTRSGTKAQQSSQQLVILDSDEDDDNYEPDEPEKAKPLQIACPMCGDEFPSIGAVQSHVDHCTGEPVSKKQRARSIQTSLPSQPVSKANTKRPERLAQLNYSMVKDNALRKKLGDLGISQSGLRPLLERRYTEWVTLWNANCDSKNPKGKAELKRELDVWERTQGGGATMTSRNPAGNIRDKDFDGVAWSKNNDDSFKDLIAQARKRAVKTEELLKAQAPESMPPSSTQSPYLPQSTAPTNLLQQQLLGQPPGSDMVGNGIPSKGPMPQPQHDMKPASPPRPSSQKRFLEDTLPPSFQLRSTEMLEKDIGISSDIATHRPLQP